MIEKDGFHFGICFILDLEVADVVEVALNLAVVLSVAGLIAWFAENPGVPTRVRRFAH